ncbi:hypothetical protein [Amantichitinum ursilacus]|uniref:Uncharacterized protein n=1 Tax=Amantichitinum ursilacus TaxID=857265 RepID=A0A0N0GL33_9NEIS|nr:hypothetical protein [Amantichitinum ursilacus]KPC49674.1 hypothetical protein WG78_20165 [Amantichitinum ursilacus]
MQQHKGYFIETCAEQDIETQDWYPTLTIGLPTDGVDPQYVVPWHRVSAPSEFGSEDAANQEALRVARMMIEAGNLPQVGSGPHKGYATPRLQ